jgi:hypothetical protein
LAFITRRLELDPSSFFGLLRFINEDGVFCEDQLNLMVEHFMKHYAPTWKSPSSIDGLQLTTEWLEHHR